LEQSVAPGAADCFCFSRFPEYDAMMTLFVHGWCTYI
jgi:hypothetical protein